MMPFEYFLETKEAKKSSPDKEPAKSLVKDMQDRIEKSLMLDADIFSEFISEKYRKNT